MKRALFALLGLSLLPIACPGQKPPVPPPASPSAEAPKGPLVWHLSKSGVGFRLSNADEDADKPVSRKVVATSPIAAQDAKRLMGRLPDLKSDPDDMKDFSLREKSIPAPRPGKTEREAFPPPAGPPPPNVTQPGPLAVERHAPEGPVEIAPHLTMTFSQPMVVVSSVDDIAKRKLPVTLVPEPPGKWRWLGTRTLMFQPDKRFPMATDYAVDIPAGTESLQGQPLSRPVHWTFTTPVVSLKGSWPNGSSTPLEPIMFAELDQAIDPAELLKSVELTSGGGPIPIKLVDPSEVEADDVVRRLAQQAEKGRWLAFKAQTKLPTATSFTVRIKAGAPSAEGPRRTTKDQAFSFSTYGPMRLTQSRCGYWREKCVPLEPFHFSFSNPIDPKRFDKQMVSVTPSILGMKVEVSGESLTVSGRTKGRTKYQVVIAGSLGDTHGQTMGEDAKATLEVGPADPALFGAEREMVVLDPASPKAYTVHSINEPGLRTRVYAVRPEDWQQYVSFHNEWERPRKVHPPGRLVVDKVVQPRKAPDELVSTAIDLVPALTGGVGQAVVVVEPTRGMPKGWGRPEVDVWVQATELGVDALIENDRITGWATRLADGAPLEGVEISLLGGGAAKTDREGLARVPLDQRPGKLVVARRGNDVAIVPEHWFGTSTYSKQTLSDSVRWLVFDDRGMYKPGEEVRVKGFVRRAVAERGGDLDAVPGIAGKSVTWLVRDPQYAELTKGTATIDDHGGFDLSFKLPGNANLGYARVEMNLGGVGLSNTSTSHAFQIEEFRRPEFEVTARTSEGPHYVGDHATATVTAAYYSGGGLPDAPVEWSVTRSTGTFTPPNRADFHFGPEPSFYWSWHVSSDPKGGPKTETWSSHTNPRGVHRLRVDFDALEPSYPMSLDFTAHVEDVNRQQWAGRTTMLVHPSDHYVGMRLAKSFIHAGENIDVDLLVADVDGKLVGDRPIHVRAARIEWERKGLEYEEQEVDVRTCEVTSPAAGAATDRVRCSLAATHGGSWRVTAVVADGHGRKCQTATQIYVMGDDAPKNRSLDRGKATVVPDKKEYAPGDVAEVLVISPFAPAEGLLTVRRQGIVHVERITLKSTSQSVRVKLEEAYVPNVQLGVQIVGSDVRDDASGTPDPKLARRPAYAAGQAWLKILPSTRTLAVSAVAKKPTLEPGGATEIDVDVKEPGGRGAAGADVALVVVDESILALSGYKTPDPVAVFYSPRGPDVRDLQLRDRVVLANPDLTRRAQATMQVGGIGSGGAGFANGGPAKNGHVMRMKLPMSAPVLMPMAPAPSATTAAEKPAGRAAPADKKKSSKDDRDSDGIVDESDVAGSTKPIQLRADFAALALFAPRVRTDQAGHATVPVKLPDNLTRYRVMAVVAAGDRMFGSNESTITARLPLMVRPSPPRFLNFGDRFELPVVVQNQTDQAADVSVVVRATNAIVEEPAAKRVKVAANDRVEVRFIGATVKPGTARFQVGVASGGWSDASQVELPVYTPATTEAFATYGEVDEGAIAQQVKMPPSVFPQFGGLEVTTSSTQLQALTDAVVYLVKYPFECNEQLASRVVAIAALKDVLTAFKAGGLPPPAALQASMQGDFEKLKRRQHHSGGWGFWQEEPWPYLSVHVTHALVRAKEKGYKPDDSMLSSAQQYLRSIESRYPRWYSEETKRAITSYALYVRKRMRDADPARARRLIAEAGGVEKLPIEAIGWIWPTISDDKGSQQENDAIRRHVSNRMTETAGAAHFVSGYKDGDWVLLHSDRRADAILLEGLIGDQRESTIIPKLVKGLLGHRKAGRWYNTQENAFVLLALDRYFNTFEKVTPDFVARAWLGERFAGQHAFKGRTTEYSHIAIPMQWLATETKGATQNLVLGKDGPGRMYYRIGMQYAPTDLKLPPADHGFVVSRLYEGAEKPEDVRRDPDGTWRVKAGSKVRVRVTMVAQSRRYHVALVDSLPAGLEPLNPALAVTGEIPKDPKVTEKQTNPYWYWSRTWYEHQNMRDERVEAFASQLWEGVWDYTYVAKATTLGTFVVPPPKAEEMYAPETFGRGAGDRMIVE